MRIRTPLLVLGIVACAEPASPRGGLVVSPDSVRVFVPQTTQLTVVGDSSGVSWRSDAPHIAAIDRTGQVTAVSSGSATVWAVRGSDSASAAVTVIHTICVAGPTVSPVNLALAPGDSARVTVRATCGPPSAGFIWSSPDTTIAVVETRETTGEETTGMIRARAPGQVAVMARSVTDPSVSGAVAVTIKAP